MPLASVGAVLKALDDKLIGEVLGKQGRPHKGEEKHSNRRIKYGDNLEYWKARLARDHPEILAAYERGEFTRYER
jgi:hypothetical protein